ncbi:hypothetical protein Cni_G05298 [Canna indica]|uniref:NET domain-containing protein n=1 Tax=Canna indica TaxID=4628 RepID=A0AAQ3JUX4_9LILI|nr:hypothetical protein Cni_G05298 [Canna indica]
MSGSSSVRKNEVGPNYFGYYKHLFSDLYPQSGDYASTPSASDLELLLGNPGAQVENFNPNNGAKDKSKCGPVSFFTRAIGGDLSDYRKERLQGVLHDSASCLNHEVDEIFGCVLATLKISSDLMEKEQPSKETCEPLGSKKRKLPSASVNSDGCFNTLNANVQFGKKVYDDIKAIKGDDAICSEAVKKCSHKIDEKLSEMEENIEEYLDMVVSKCRTMTSAEKQQLGRKIQKLPGKAYDGMVGILQRKNPSATEHSDIIEVNLKELDNVTLWRLYFYVQSVVKAKEL